MPWRRVWQPAVVFLPGESPWTEEPGGLLDLLAPDSSLFLASAPRLSASLGSRAVSRASCTWKHQGGQQGSSSTLGCLIAEGPHRGWSHFSVTSVGGNLETGPLLLLWSQCLKEIAFTNFIY